MFIREQTPDIQALKRYRQKIASTKIESSDPAVGQLCESADQLTAWVGEADICRTRELACVLAQADSQKAMISPEVELKLRQELEGITDEAERKALQEAIAQMERAREQEYQRFEKTFFSAAKRLREQCYMISQINMADPLIDTFAEKRATLDRLVRWSEDTLAPLIRDLSAQIKAVDESMAETLSKNVFDHALELLPEASTVADLVKKDSPSSDTGEKKTEAAEPKVDEDKPLTIPVVACENAAKAGTTAALSAAVPEEAALKLAYEALQNTLKMFSESTDFYKKVGEHAKLWDRLTELKDRYHEAQKQQHAVSLDLSNLDGLSQHLNRVGLYLEEIEKLDTTLNAYARALNSSHQNPETYYTLFVGLMRYLEKLELAWR